MRKFFLLVSLFVFGSNLFPIGWDVVRRSRDRLTDVGFKIVIGALELAENGVASLGGEELETNDIVANPLVIVPRIEEPQVVSAGQSMVAADSGNLYISNSHVSERDIGRAEGILVNNLNTVNLLVEKLSGDNTDIKKRLNNQDTKLNNQDAKLSILIDQVNKMPKMEFIKRINQVIDSVNIDNVGSLLAYLLSKRNYIRENILSDDAIIFMSIVYILPTIILPQMGDVFALLAQAFTSMMPVPISAGLTLFRAYLWGESICLFTNKAYQIYKEYPDETFLATSVLIAISGIKVFKDMVF